MQSPSLSAPKHRHLTLAALLLLAAPSSAQNNLATRALLTPYAITPLLSNNGLDPLVPIYQRSIDFAVSNKSFQLGYRENSERQDGFWNLELVANDESDFVLDLRLLRVGQLVGKPIRLGVGFAGYAASYDDSGEKLYALALCGVAQVDLPTSPPTTASLELSVAPEISTFEDGQDVLDIVLRLEAQISSGAVAYIGARLLDARTDSDDEFVRALQVGIRLGL